MNDHAGTAIIGGLAVLALTGLGAWYYLGTGASVAPIAPDVPSTSVTPEAAPAIDAGVAPAPRPRPAKDADDVLRKNAKRVVKTPLAEWLGAPGIVQRFTAAVWRIADGKSPAPVLGFITIEGRFEVDEPKGTDDIFMSKRGYRRYDAIAEAVAKIDAKEAARAYRIVRPHFDAAYAQVSEGERFDAVLERAIGRVTAVEIPEGRIRLVEKGAIFHYADPELEALPDAEKHLLRMGPTNAAKIQKALRRFAEAAL